MTKVFNTKRALIASVISVVICISMLVGTTFAWFTDTATVNGNKIQAGTLDIQLVDPATGENMEGKTISFVDKNGNTDILWEPGCTFVTQPVRFINNSNLSIEVETLITGFTGDLELLDVIEFKLLQWDTETGTFYDPTESDWNGRISAFQAFVFGTQKNDGKPVEMTDFVICAHMSEDAGNEYQGLALDSCSITLRARQMAQESDSFNNRYDTDATWPVAIKNTDELMAALGTADSVTIDTGDYKLPISLPEGKELIIAGGNFASDEATGPALEVSTGSKLVINAADIDITGYETAVEITGTDASVELNGGTYDVGNKMQVINAQKKGANVVINDGEYSGGTLAVWVNEDANVTINGGIFRTYAIVFTDSDYYSGSVTINGGDFSKVFTTNAGTPVTLVINGGTFGFNPENEAFTTIGAGHTVVDNGNGTWTVQ